MFRSPRHHISSPKYLSTIRGTTSLERKNHYNNITSEEQRVFQETISQVRRYHSNPRKLMNTLDIYRAVPVAIEEREFKRNCWTIMMGIWGGFWCEFWCEFWSKSENFVIGDHPMIKFIMETMESFALPITLILVSPILYHTIRIRQLRYLQKNVSDELDKFRSHR